MSLQPNATPVRNILSFFFGYIKYLASIPAIFLQTLCLFLGASGIFYFLFTSFPNSASTIVVTIMGWFNTEHVSWSGNPVPGILTAYFILGLALEVGTWILKTFFHIEWEWSGKKTLFTLTALSGVNCLVMATSLAQSGRSDFGVSLFIFFLITFFATLFAVVVGKILDAIEGAIKV